MTGTDRIHPGSAAVMAALEAEVAGLLYWTARDLDTSVEMDDVVQALALAQLETQATGGRRTGLALRREVQRRVRREVWQVRGARGRAHRVEWNQARMQHLVGPDAGLATEEEIGWDDIVRILGWQDGLAFWLWVIEEWPLAAIGEWQAVSKQQVWRRIQQARERLRQHLGTSAH